MTTDPHLDKAAELNAAAKEYERLAAEAYRARHAALMEAREAGVSYGQIAERLGITRGGAQTIVHSKPSTN